MTSPHLSDQLRRIRVAEERDPVEAALAAVACLSASQTAAFVSRYNSVFASGGRKPRVLMQTGEPL